MDLIIKPTQACNFKCAFCSSCNIEENSAHLESKDVTDFLDGHDVNTVIVNGGDPLMMPPSFYWDIVNHIRETGKDTTLSFTTNLWDFYKHPEKWEELFLQPEVYVTTSFQYGGERRLGNGEPLTEELFIDMMDEFEIAIGYAPMFISVITPKNEDDVIRTVELAQELRTDCKINPALKSGRTTKGYPIHKAVEKWLDIIDAGLKKYEFNAKHLKETFDGRFHTCPFNRNCYKTIRCMGPNKELFTCGSIHDCAIERKAAGLKTYDLAKYDEREIKQDYPFLKPECLGCEMFNLCNSCFKQIMDIQESGDIEEHCAGMKKLQGRLEAL